MTIIPNAQQLQKIYVKTLISVIIFADFFTNLLAQSVIIF